MILRSGHQPTAHASGALAAGNKRCCVHVTSQQYFLARLWLQIKNDTGTALTLPVSSVVYLETVLSDCVDSTIMYLVQAALQWDSKQVVCESIDTCRLVVFAFGLNPTIRAFTDEGRSENDPL